MFQVFSLLNGKGLVTENTLGGFQFVPRFHYFNATNVEATLQILNFPACLPDLCEC